MSEYQYYEFLAVDRPLTKQEMGELRAISTRAISIPSALRMSGLAIESSRILASTRCARAAEARPSRASAAARRAAPGIRGLLERLKRPIEGPAP